MDDVDQQVEPVILGTGGSLRQALNRLTDEPLLVMNGDIFHQVDLAALYQEHLAAGNPVTLAMHDFHRFNHVQVTTDGYVIGFTAGNKMPGEHLLAFTGIHVLDMDVIRRIPEGGFFHIIDLYQQMAVQQEGLAVHRTDGSYWCDIGTVDDYLHLHSDILTGGVPSLQIPRKSANGWCIDVEAAIDPSVQLTGWGYVGAEASIGKEAHLHNCVVWDGAVVESGQEHVNALITPTVERHDQTPNTIKLNYLNS
jgi:mannose-1-phosphate guanylyltransferase